MTDDEKLAACEKAAAIVGRGGHLFVAQDVLLALQASLRSRLIEPEGGDRSMSRVKIHGVLVVPSLRVPPGCVYAMPPERAYLKKEARA